MYVYTCINLNNPGKWILKYIVQTNQRTEQENHSNTPFIKSSYKTRRVLGLKNELPLRFFIPELYNHFATVYGPCFIKQFLVL